MKNINFKTLSIIIVLVIINLLTVNYFKSIEDKLSRENQNLTAKNDTIRKEYNQVKKEYTFSKQSYLVAKAKDLEHYNKSLYNQVKQAKNTAIAIQATQQISLPSQSQLNKQLDTASNQLTTEFRFLYSDSSVNQLISGKNRINLLNKEVLTTLDTNKLSVKLSYNIVNKSNKYIVSAFSRSKYIDFSDLNSVLILNQLPAKQQNKWSLGLFAGFGLNSDVRGLNVRAGWSAGVGLNYRIY
jgi:hypothetical protein